jgi:hypothetical protein
MEGNALGKLAVAILLMVFVFSLGNLVFNLENLYIGGDSIPEFVNPGAPESDVASHQTLANAVRWAWFGFLGFCVFALVVGAITFTASKDRKKWRKLFVQILSVLLFIGCIFAFGYFYEDIESSVMGGGSTDILPDGGGDTPSQDGDDIPSAPDTLRVVLTFGVFAVIFLFAISIFIATANFIKMRSSKLDYSDMEKDTKEVAGTIQRTIDALARGSDTRATVIRCYTDMCKVVSKYGVDEEEHLTPREFLKLALDKLPVPREQMGALVDVFEEARYSQHKLGESEGIRAVTALEAVKGKLLEYKPSQAGGGEKPGA